MPLDHALGIAGELPDGMIDPEEDATDKEDRPCGDEHANHNNLAAAGTDVGHHITLLLIHSEHSDNLTRLSYRRPDIHHRATFVIMMSPRRACTVAPLQRLSDIMIGGVILPHPLSCGGVKQHLPRLIRDVVC